MQVLDQVSVRWVYPTGLSGGPGYNVFYGPNLAANLNSIRGFYDAIKLFLPLNMGIYVLGSGIKVQDTDGKQVGDWSVAAPAVVTGTAASAGVIPQAGIVVDWRTTGRNWRGHRIAGKSFLVPAANAVYGTDGKISQSNANTINTAATNMLSTAGGTVGVWSRPVLGDKDAVTGVRPVIHEGIWATASSTNVPTTPATLRSRRD